MKTLIYLIIAALIVGGAAVLIGQKATTAVSEITSDTILEGNKIIAKNEKLILKNGASLTVKGDLVIDGSLECENGSIKLTVTGNMSVNKNLSCSNGGLAMSIAVLGSLVFDDDAIISTNGSVQLADNPAKLAGTIEQLDGVFDKVESDSGSPLRIGPFVFNGGQEKIENGLLAKVAHAQASEPCIDANGALVPNCVKIGGKWIIGEGEEPPASTEVPTPPKGVKKVIINFDFGPNHDFRIQNFSLSGPDGRAGADDINKSCNAKGKDGEDAFRVRISAGNVTIDNFELTLGNGGMGGAGETIKNCEHGQASGGKGGKPGNLKIEATKSLNIAGAFIINPGRGGEGGKAIAHGRDGANGCPAQKGGDATARGGNGGDNKKELKAVGNIAGVKNVEVSPTRGGNGGEAIANPGKGGSGTGCGCKGGDGGKGMTFGGKGGDANISILGTVAETSGGRGGNADSHGGLGGNGGMCNSEGPGGNGGKGGDATSAKGLGGKAKKNGEDGKVTNETGGNGGNGGDGCPEGKEGKGGKGNPNGKDGSPGKNLCLPATAPTPDIQTEIIQMDLQGMQPPTSQPPTSEPTSPTNEEPRTETQPAPTQEQSPTPPQESGPSYYY